MDEARLADLIERCAEESARFARRQEHDDRFCLELFRRAIVERNAPAWEAIHAQYQRLVRDWMWQHAYAHQIADHDDFVMRVFERFWQALTPDKFATFTHLAALLRYLKLCTIAALIDAGRAQRAWQGRRAGGELADEVEGERVDEGVLDELGRAALWRTVEAALPDPVERLVVYLSCAMGLKPREIARRYATHFPAVEEVYRRKRLALERLRRDSGVRAFLSE